MKQFSLIALAGLAIVAGCVTAHSIQPFGKDTYMMPADVVASYNAKLANEFCAKRGLMMQPESMDRMAFVFRCVDAKHALAEKWGPAPAKVDMTVKH